MHAYAHTYMYKNACLHAAYIQAFNAYTNVLFLFQVLLPPGISGRFSIPLHFRLVRP